MVELKRVGFDAMGKSQKPICGSGRVIIKDARELWGKETKEIQPIIKAKLADEHIQVVSIALAGEKMVRYACIMKAFMMPQVEEL